MRSIAVLQHEALQGPDFLAHCLQQQGWSTRIFRPDKGEPVPRQARDFAGLVVLGSDHSVHDHLDWIATERALLADALAHDVPVLGHCFGAQQLAVAAGGSVCRNAWPNIGWSRVWLTPDAREMFLGAAELQVFNWHYDTFALPPGARRTMYGAHCLNKGYRLGPHLGFQCHLEVTEDGVRRWCESGRAEIAAHPGPAVQTRSELLRDLPLRARQLQRFAREAYRRWAESLPRPPVSFAGGVARF
ncbi:type 1 glutamine amidotransferase [Roseateles sp. DC23W]|uniref:Type 1 glutamine amidotransferase n=1 Tax=Pelomonas dachongensis TaxID=3299029 RepID=A0ABW7ESY9_9BURK